MGGVVPGNGVQGGTHGTGIRSLGPNTVIRAKYLIFRIFQWISGYFSGFPVISVEFRIFPDISSF